MTTNLVSTRFDSTGLSTRTGNAEKIVLYAKFQQASPQLVKLIEELTALVNQPIHATVEWLQHQDTVTHGKDAAIRTNGTTLSIQINSDGTLEDLEVVDIYIPLTTEDAVSTRLHCMGPNSVRFYGHINGAETEAIVVEPGVTLHLISDAGNSTNIIVEHAETAPTTFTAQIYEANPDVVIPFTAEIYDDQNTFTAEIYEGT